MPLPRYLRAPLEGLRRMVRGMRKTPTAPRTRAASSQRRPGAKQAGPGRTGAAQTGRQAPQALIPAAQRGGGGRGGLDLQVGDLEALLKAVLDEGWGSEADLAEWIDRLIRGIPPQEAPPPSALAGQAMPPLPPGGPTGPGGAGGGGAWPPGGFGGFGGAGGGGGGGGRYPQPPGGGRGGVPVNVDGQWITFPANHPIVTAEMVPVSSSNIYSIGYDNDSHTLMVRFVGRHSHKDNSRRPGSIYAYFHVPARRFLQFLDAASKGKWLWDNVRIRGTISGHRYDYALVGIEAGYVPRKATLTPLGEAYIQRQVWTDKSRLISSPLPEQLVRPLAPVLRPGRPPKDGRRGLGG